MASYEMFDGKLHLYRRDNSRYWHCSTSIGKNRLRTSTKKDNLTEAKLFAEDWYLEIRGKARAGLLKSEKTFADAAEQFQKEYGIITEGQRSPAGSKGITSGCACT